ncbi:peptidase S51 [Microbacterium sp. 1P10UB]|uniref:peptidase S51 n=1 Tax=unclassified Microbacterium TaxID=2609290 RepID=UPI0039A05944
MGIHLIGGGRDEARVAAVVAPFVRDAAAAAGDDPPVIAVLVVVEAHDTASVDRYRAILTAAGASPASIRIRVVVEGDRFDGTAVAGAHGIFVGGGLTPAYHDALIGIRDAVRERVAAGAAYAGFSAGAAIVPDRALVGGYRWRGTQVSPEDAGEELDELDVREGLGLVEGSVDVHAAQWGTVSRLVAAVAAGLVPHGVAIDEHTAWTLSAGGRDSAVVSGDGGVWLIEAMSSGVQVSLRRLASHGATGR